MEAAPTAESTPTRRALYRVRMAKSSIVWSTMTGARAPSVRAVMGVTRWCIQNSGVNTLE